MQQLLLNFPYNWKHAIDIYSLKNIPNIVSPNIEHVCVLGMGGSAIGAHLLVDICYHRMIKPCVIIGNYNIPNWINKHTLVIACSYSGNTEEVLSSLDKSLKTTKHIISISSGGQLKEKSRKENIPFIEISDSTLPPRMALPYSFVALYSILAKVGVIPYDINDLLDTFNLLLDQVRSFNSSDSFPHQIATNIKNTIPIIYGDSTYTSAVARRWTGQFQENAKHIAWRNDIPEMNHNEWEGWANISKSLFPFSILFLGGKEEHFQITARNNICFNLLLDKATYCKKIYAQGNSRMAQIFSLVQLADWVSYYIALHKNIDPIAVDNIQSLKTRLSLYTS